MKIITLAFEHLYTHTQKGITDLSKTRLAPDIYMLLLAFPQLIFGAYQISRESNEGCIACCIPQVQQKLIFTYYYPLHCTCRNKLVYA